MKKYLKTLLVLIIILSPALSNALSLGRVVTKSIQGEPLNADIRLDDIPINLDIKQLKVNLATVSDFKEVGLSLQSYHKDLSFKAYKDSKSKWFISVKSKKPLNKQFVNFLVAVDHPKGHIVREYMVILKSSIQSAKNSGTNNSSGNKLSNNDFELATTQANKKVIRLSDGFNNGSLEQYLDPKSAAAIKTVKSNPKPASKPGIVIKTTGNIKSKSKSNDSVSFTKAKPKNNIIEFSSNSNSQVKTIKGDNLWNIAQRNVSNQRDVRRMIVAIYYENQSAFINNNINLLMANKTLKIPALAEVAKISQQEIIDTLSPSSNTKTTKVTVVSNTKKFVNNTQTRATKTINRLDNNASKSDNQKDITKITSSSKAIRLSSVDGDINKLQINNTPVANQVIKAQKPIAKSKDIIKLTSIQDDLVKLENTLSKRTRANDKEIKRLRVVSAENTLPNQTLLAAEKLIAKQKENKNLREQVLILQAQLNDMNKLLELRKKKSLASRNSNNGLQSNTEQLSLDKAKEQIANNPLLPVDMPDLNKSATNHTQKTITNSDAMLAATNDDFIIKNTLYDDLIAAKSKATAYLGKGVNTLSKIGKKLSGSQNKLVFFVWIVSLLGGLGLIGLFYYWRKYYRLQPVMPDFISEEEDQKLDMADALLNEEHIEQESELPLDEFVVDDIIVKSGSRAADDQIAANLDLVKAYIELNDIITAKKILDEIMSTGDNEQVAEAKKILESIPA